MFAALVASCKPKPTDRSGRKEGLGTLFKDYFDSSSIVLSRDSTKKIATLSFNIRGDLGCRFQYWEDTDNENRKEVNCDGIQSSKVTQIFENLTPHSKLTIAVYLWRTSPEKDGISFEVPEKTFSLNLKSANILKMAIPQLSNEIGSIEFQSETPVSDLWKKLQRKEGCLKGPPPNNMETLSKIQQLRVKNVSSTGFATAPATSHPFFANLLQQFYDSYDFKTTYNFAYKNTETDKDLQFSSNRPARISTMNLMLPTVHEIGGPSQRKLTTPEKVIKYESKDIIVTWIARSVPPNTPSNMVVKVVSVDKKNQIHCSFNPAEGKGTISKADINSFPPGRYELTVVLESYQFFSKNDPDFIPWIIVSNDWRWAILEKS